MNSLLIAFPAPPEVLARAKNDYPGGQFSERTLTPDEIVAAAEKYQLAAILVVGGQKIGRDVIARFPSSLKCLATFSVGFDHIDIEAAAERNLPVVNTPEVLDDCTADIAMLLLLNACRRTKEYQKIMQAGWGQKFGPADWLGTKVSGKKLGILGMGRIGRALARRARGFGMEILYCNRQRLAPDLEEGANYFADFRTMLPHCQILSLHAPSNPSTQKIMNRETFSLLPNGAVFINTARGQLVDESALMENLKSGKLFAAGLDVFENEPNIDPKLNELPNLFLIPHMGSATVETRNAMGFRSLDNIDAVLAGRAPSDQVLPRPKRT